MTAKDAQKRIATLLGKKAVWRDSGIPSSPEDRDWHTAASRAAKEKREYISQRLKARREELLRDDTEYQSILADYNHSLTIEKSVDKTRRGGYRIAVGVDMGFAWEIKAHGDNWADVVRALEAKHKTGAI